MTLPENRIETECTSVGGWLTELAGHIPAIGETVSGDWFTMTVTRMEEQRVDQLRLTLLPAGGAPQTDHE